MGGEKETQGDCDEKGCSSRRQWAIDCLFLSFDPPPLHHFARLDIEKEEWWLGEEDQRVRWLDTRTIEQLCVIPEYNKEMKTPVGTGGEGQRTRDGTQRNDN